MSEENHLCRDRYCCGTRFNCKLNGKSFCTNTRRRSFANIFKIPEKVSTENVFILLLQQMHLYKVFILDVVSTFLT